MSHSICFPPRKVTAKVYVTKMASQKKVPQITTTNKNNKNTTDLRFQTLSSASLWCARILFVNERENAARLLLCCVATFGNILNSIFCGHPNFRFFLFFFVSERSPKGRKVFFDKKNISTRVCMVLNSAPSKNQRRFCSRVFIVSRSLKARRPFFGGGGGVSSSIWRRVEVSSRGPPAPKQ